MSLINDNKNSNNNNNKALKILKNILIGVLVLFGLFLFFNYIFIWILPFIIAWGIAFLLQPAVKFLNSALRVPKKLASVVLVLLLIFAIGFLIFLIIDRLIYELNILSRTFKIDSETVTIYIDNFFNWLENILDRIPFLSGSDIIDRIKIQIENMAATFVTDLGAFLAAKVPSIITSIIVVLPSFLIFTLISIISTFYISFDYASINKFLMLQVPEKVRNIILDIKNRFLEAIYKYLRAYLIILSITYFELVTGFLIIGIKYAFLLAFFVALIDIFPIVGTGTVLIPWGIINIIQKDYFTGFALLILYATVTIIRQVIEPKIIGKSLGLYPVVTLIMLYMGYNILGFFGMILFPICMLLIKNLNDEGRIHLWKNIDKADKTDKTNKTDDKKNSSKDISQKK